MPNKTLSDSIAFELHEAWRKPRLQADGTYEPRWKKIKDEVYIERLGKMDKMPAYVRVNENGEHEIDIANACYFQLSEDWKAENKAAAQVVADMIESGKEYTDAEAGEIIHNAWLERNSWAKDGELGVPFAELPVDEQEKDLVQYRIAKTMSYAKEYKGWANHIDDAVAILEAAKQNGENIYVSFNDEKLYSMFDTADTCYLKLCGETKAEHDKALAEWRKEYQERQARQKAEALGKVEDWYKRGREMIYREKWNKWYDCVKTCAEGLFHGAEIESSLKIMDALHQGKSMEEVSEIMSKEGYSGGALATVLTIVTKFSERGPELYRHFKGEELIPEDEEFLQKIEEMNSYYASVAERRPQKDEEIVKKFDDKRFEK